MKKIFLSKDRIQYRANLHSHSTRSDGRLSPEEMAEAYRRNGYSILAITDHESPKCHRELCREDFLLITGYEVYIRPDPSAKCNIYRPEVHLNLFARDQENEAIVCYNPSYCKYLTDPDQRAALRKVGSQRTREYTVEYVNEFIQTAKEAGYLVAYNHPVWSLEDEERILAYEGLFSLEIDNAGTQMANGMEYGGHLYDKLLLRRRRLVCHSADDNHNKDPLDSPRSDSFGAFTMILSDSLSYGDVIRAMEQGDMYASTGPLIHEISMEDGKIHVESSPAKQILCFTGTRIPLRATAKPGETLTEATFSPDPVAPYFRIVVLDDRDQRATSRGYFREEYS